MKAIILAAGQGVRMRPLTEDRPKQLVELKGKPLLDHILAALPEEISELIFVIGYRGEQLRKYYGDLYKEKPITYVEQTGEGKGTWYALSLCKPYLLEGERFFVMYADDLHGREGLKECVDRARDGDGCTMLVAEVEDPRKFGVVEMGEGDSIATITEKPEHPKSNLVSSGAFVLTTDVFRYRPEAHNGEEYLAHSIRDMIVDGHTYYAVQSTFWFPMGSPEDIERGEKHFSERDQHRLA